MKIIGILSSPHRNGSTAKLLNEALKGAGDRGAEVEFIYLPDYDLKFCVGCQTCLSEDHCALQDDINPLREKVLRADGLILASPAYEADINAVMKNFFDRIMPYTGYRSTFRSKYVAGISTAGAFGAKKTAKRLTELVTGFHQMGKVSGTLAAHVGWGEVQPYMDKAKRLGEKIADDIISKKAYRLQQPVRKLIFNLIVKNGMEKMIIENKDGKRRAVYQ